MKRTVRWLIWLTLVAWSMPAAADVPNDDCGSKEPGDACEDFSGAAGVCVDDDDDDDEPIYCDTSLQPTADAGDEPDEEPDEEPNEKPDDNDDGCSVQDVGANGRAETAALSLLLMVCVALRKRFS